MGLSGCYGVIKYLMVLINFFFWLIGFGVVILAIWMLTDKSVYISMAQDPNHYYYSLYIFLAAGILMLVVAFFGCCGAFKESQCMLISFFAFLLVILVAEVAAGIWAYTNSHDLELKIRNAVKSTVQEEYGTVHSRTETFDVIQKNLECCGANGPRDWNGSSINKKKDLSGMSLSVSNSLNNYTIPASCCRLGTEGSVCEKATNAKVGGNIHPAIYSQGCIDKLVDVVKAHMYIVTGVTIGIIVVEVLGIIFALVLCFGINRSDRYKA